MCVCVYRLEQLVTLFLHKNHLSYLPQCLTNIHTLKMIVVSGDELNCIPTRLCSNPAIKYATALATAESGPAGQFQQHNRKTHI